jgi:hypothetical protein
MKDVDDLILHVLRKESDKKEVESTTNKGGNT